ncbi:dihydroxyacetone kinase subunit DhaK [Bradyrhizobium sp. AUGA SZCCT0222]|uniref:dihydroxyacetone kinase subunit DhaK n=1 Tax=Bradyrhizobium sp. AUGA SZCCT0222 TaxID=2807668 RepID=UPI001BAD5F26|nr:dihydroxyacetone kinase subunit DhaK [Bradyrhizobium sp. AUGA SZCCT0222]MBR1269367.1 dihydroxyacetone kinase subunit DhaK [Bradyrhizobium sp. AUGA SZCCT0222]
MSSIGSVITIFEIALDGAGITTTRFLTGSYVKALDMAGASVTVSVLDAQAKSLWDAPVHTATLRWGA